MVRFDRIGWRCCRVDPGADNVGRAGSGDGYPRIDPTLVDTSGNEQIWRVWWRARDDYVQLDQQWLVTLGLCMLLAVFVIGVLAAIWIALSPQAEPTDTIE